MRIELNAKPNRCLWFPYANEYQITSHNSNHTITMATTTTLYLTTNKIITTLMIIITTSYSQIVRLFTQSVKIIHFFTLLITWRGAQSHYSKYFIEFYKKKLTFANYFIFVNFPFRTFSIFTLLLSSLFILYNFTSNFQLSLIYCSTFSIFTQEAIYLSFIFVRYYNIICRVFNAPSES